MFNFYRWIYKNTVRPSKHAASKKNHPHKHKLSKGQLNHKKFISK